MRINPIDKLAKLGNRFTFKGAQKALGTGYDITKVILSRLEKKGRIERVEKGKYIIIPLGAEKGKYTLHEFVIGAMLVKPYSVAYWSALHYYGLTEQIPMTVFIQTTARKKRQKLKILEVNYQIVRVKESKFFAFKTEWIEDSRVKITDKEKTVLDCLDKPKHCGGIIEAIKALRDPSLSSGKLVSYAERFENSGVMRRLGYLCEMLGIKIQLPQVKSRSYLPLDPTMAKVGPRNARWKLVINTGDKLLEVLE